MIVSYVTAGIGVLVLVVVLLTVRPRPRLRRLTRAADDLRAGLDRGRRALPAVRSRPPR